MRPQQVPSTLYPLHRGISYAPPPGPSLGLKYSEYAESEDSPSRYPKNFKSLITFSCLTNTITRRRGPELLILANFL
jgi:hypothetical protein